MSEHRAIIRWQNTSQEFRKGRYSREHTWSFDGGAVVQASPSPAVVPVPYSNPTHVDPEEAFVAAIASCHMLTFLDLARQRGFEVESYEDEAVGTLTKNERGARWVSAVVLTPRIAYTGTPPAPEELDQLHEAAHELCFIANSVKTEIRIARSG
jgi:organic hydroperoxide reductase OsmC/OhrA